MSKKILLSLAIIGVAAAMVVGATTAYFTSTETSEGNTFSAGTLELSLSGQSAQDFSVNFSDMAPGEWTGEKKLHLKNTGSLTNVVDSIKVSALNYTQSSNSGWVGAKEFAKKLNVKIRRQGKTGFSYDGNLWDLSKSSNGIKD